MDYEIPLVDVQAQHRAIRDELLEAVTRCLDGGRYILGEEVVRLEEEIAAYSEVEFAVGVSSGTDALLLALLASGIGPGDEVLTTAYSFFATAGTVARLGAKPVFVDIDPSSYNLDPSRIEERVGERTKAIVPVHLYGQFAEMAPILEIATRRGLPVLEDAAQAIGARDETGRRAGSLGALGCFSFYPSKNLSAAGDAGMVVTRDEALAASMRRLRAHGESETYRHEVVGGNFRLDEIQAAILRVKLRRLPSWTRARQENAKRYEALFRETALVEDGAIVLPSAVGEHVYHQYVIRARERDALRGHLAEHGIASGVYYPYPLPLQPCFEELGYGEGDFPEAEKASKETLALPMYPELTEAQQQKVVRAIEAFYTGSRGGATKASILSARRSQV